ncbi:MAG: hypothetical protein IT431_15605 [Phycisphaerales bacterium]|nr:hypothetical protein [Phycisphaerales bacterium]
MPHLAPMPCIVVYAIATAIGLPAARADIAGFGDFSEFSINKDDGNAWPTVTPEGIHLTGNAAGESRSVFHMTRQGVTQFTASFTYLMTGDPTGRFGGCFVIQNSGQGYETVAAASVSGVQTKFGYSDFWGSFNNSVAVSLEYASLDAQSSSSAVYTDGQVGGGSTDTTPLDLFAGRSIDVTISYDGTLLHTQMLDQVDGSVFDSWSPIDIPAFVGGDTAYVGFTA